jgi:hypothetical protein
MVSDPKNSLPPRGLRGKEKKRGTLEKNPLLAA